MHQATITINGKSIHLTAGKDAIYRLSSYLEAPLYVTQCLSNGDYTMQTLFGQSWNWSERPAELKAQYDKELAEYTALLPTDINARTTLPQNNWYKKYIPSEKEINALREDRKTPEEKAAEIKMEEEQKKRNDEAAAKRAAEDKEREAEEARILKEYPFLQRVDNSISAVNCASENIRRLLSRLWPAVNFSVRLSKYSMGNSIDIRWTDGPTSKQVEKWVNNFQEGYFDGMTDSYEYTKNAWHVFGESKYIHCNRRTSPETISKYMQIVSKAMAEADAAHEKKDDSTLHPIERTEFSINTEGYGYKLWKDHFLSNCNSADAIIERMESESNGMPELPITNEPANQTEENIINGIATLRRNTEKNGLEIIFASKPAENILTWLKYHGYRWSRFSKVWYKHYSDQVEAEAREYLKMA